MRFADLRLHLIEPLGFEISDNSYAEADGLLKDLDVHIHSDWAAFESSEHPNVCGSSALAPKVTGMPSSHWGWTRFRKEPPEFTVAPR